MTTGYVHTGGGGGSKFVFSDGSKLDMSKVKYGSHAIDNTIVPVVIEAAIENGGASTTSRQAYITYGGKNLLYAVYSVNGNWTTNFYVRYGTFFYPSYCSSLSEFLSSPSRTSNIGTSVSNQYKVSGTATAWIEL